MTEPKRRSAKPTATPEAKSAPKPAAKAAAKAAAKTTPKAPAAKLSPKPAAKRAPKPTATPVVAADPGAAQARTTPWLSVSVGLAVVMVVVLVVVTALLSSQTSRNNHNQTVAASSYLLGTSAKAAQTAAVADVKATLTYDYKTLDADFARAEKGLTPSFRSSYVHTTETSVRPLATKYHAISAASVAASGVSEASVNDATVLLFVDQTVQNTQLPHPRLDRSRIRVSMVRQNGHWLVNHLAPL